MFTLLVMIPNLMWPWIAKVLFRVDITFRETIIHLAIVSIAVFGLLWISKWSAVSDVQVFNGYVINKTYKKVSCSHSYPCNPVTTCNQNGCTTSYSTCYHHPYDIDWIVHATLNHIDINESISIRRIDSRGTREPPRWTQVAIGDPVTVTKTYSNYILAAPNSLFNFDFEHDYNIPQYPSKVYDYYNLDRVVLDGNVPNVDLVEWNSELSMMLSRLGPSHKVNVILVLTDQPSSEYANALRAEWRGGKQNDVIVVVNADISWVEVISWSESELFKVKIRDDIISLETLDRVAIYDSIRDRIIESYSVRSMDDFEYLKHQMAPSFPQTIIAFIICLILNITLTIVFIKHEV